MEQVLAEGWATPLTGFMTEVVSLVHYASNPMELASVLLLRFDVDWQLAPVALGCVQHATARGCHSRGNLSNATVQSLHQEFLNFGPRKG